MKCFTPIIWPLSDIFCLSVYYETLFFWWSLLSSLFPQDIHVFFTLSSHTLFWLFLSFVDLSPICVCALSKIILLNFFFLFQVPFYLPIHFLLCFKHYSLASCFKENILHVWKYFLNIEVHLVEDVLFMYLFFFLFLSIVLYVLTTCRGISICDCNAKWFDSANWIKANNLDNCTWQLVYNLYSVHRECWINFKGRLLH